MNHVSPEKRKHRLSTLYITFMACGVLLITGCVKDPPKPKLKMSTIATGLMAPIGLEIDNKGRVWVAESGTGDDDGRITVITPDGKKYDVITHLESRVAPTGEPDGPSHLLFADGLLYIMGTAGKMYKADLSKFQPGDAPLSPPSLGVENIGAFVLAYNFVNKTNESHPYNLVPGPDGAIYIADAGANAIIRRARTGALSVVAEVPGIANPTPVGPPRIESVPTGIMFDGQHFLVTTLLGFPFPPGKSVIYKISPSGAVDTFQGGFTSLVDIAEGGSSGRLVLEHGTFGATGFAARSGRLVWANGTDAKVLAEGLNLPAGLKQADEHTWYVTSLGDGSVLKVKY